MNIENFLKLKYSKAIIIIVGVFVAIILCYFMVTFQIQHQKKVNYSNIQNKCSLEAEKIVFAMQSTNSVMRYSYTYHYNFGLSKCYLTMLGLGITGVGVSDKLIDVYANKTMADCESYGMAPQLNFCSYNGVKIVFNVDNFNDFIKQYMETY